jgi:recombinational DNA repair ATPase RecF
VSVATQKTCSSTDNIRLSFLQQQISEVSKTVLHQLYCLPQYLEEHNKLIKITQEQTAMFLSTVDQAFLSTNEITLDQQVYFEQATLVIQSIDDVFEHQLTQISNSLDVT